MIWLKLSCPFGGKHYPYYILMATVWIVTIVALMGQWDVSSYYLAIFGLPAAELVGCFLWEHHLSMKDHQMITESELPLWEPLPEGLPEAVAEYAAREISIGEFITMIVFVLSAPFVLLNALSFMRPVGLLVMLPCAALIVSRLYSRTLWRQIDETAVAARVPISHMYDVDDNLLHVVRSYLVFYLPDGKYTLRARPGTGLSRAVWLVRYRGHVLWLPEPNREL